MVCLLLAAKGKAALYEYCLELALVRNTLDGAQHSNMSSRGDAVGVTDGGDFVGIFDHAASVDCRVERGEVSGLEGSNVKTQARGSNLGCDREERGATGLSKRGKMGRERSRGKNLVDVESGQGVGGREGETRPDHRLRINGRNEEGQAGGWDVVGQMAVWEGATGEVVEVAALAASVSGVQI